MSKQDIIDVAPERAALFVQWRFGFSPEAAIRFCQHDIRRRPKIAATSPNQHSAAVKWLQIWLLVLQHEDTLAAWREFNTKFPSAGRNFGTATLYPAPGSDIGGRGVLSAANKPRVTFTGAKRMPGLGF